MDFATFKTQKKNEFNHWVSFSPQGSSPGISLGVQGHNFELSSRIGSVWSGRPGLRTYEAKSDAVGMAYNSRLRERYCISEFILAIYAKFGVYT